MEPIIRYCTAPDGTSLAYIVEGDGPPLVWMPNFGGLGYMSQPEGVDRPFEHSLKGIEDPVRVFAVRTGAVLWS